MVQVTMELLVKVVRLRELLGHSELKKSGKPLPPLGLEGQVSPGRAGALEEPLLTSFPWQSCHHN